MVDAVPLVVLGLAFLFFGISANEDTPIRKKWYFVLSLMFVLGTLKVAKEYVTDSGLTDLTVMFTEFYVGFAYIVYLEIFIAFAQILIMIRDAWRVKAQEGANE